MWGVTQHLPQHPAHPSGFFLLHQEKDFSRETGAKDSWEETGAKTKQAGAAWELEL